MSLLNQRRRHELVGKFVRLTRDVLTRGGITFHADEVLMISGVSGRGRFTLSRRGGRDNHWRSALRNIERSTFELVEGSPGNAETNPR